MQSWYSINRAADAVGCYLLLCTFCCFCILCKTLANIELGKSPGSAGRICYTLPVCNQGTYLDPNLVLDGADARWDASHDIYIFAISVRYSTYVKLCSRGMWSHNWLPQLVGVTRSRYRCVTTRVTSAYTNFPPKARLLDFSGFRQL